MHWICYWLVYRGLDRASHLLMTTCLAPASPHSRSDHPSYLSNTIANINPTPMVILVAASQSVSQPTPVRPENAGSSHFHCRKVSTPRQTRVQSEETVTYGRRCVGCVYLVDNRLLPKCITSRARPVSSSNQTAHHQIHRSRRMLGR